jgi:RNA polymerase sigma-70 factor (ECF subfamily)
MVAAMTTTTCCGRPSAEQCRCHTDAAAIADAIRAFVARRVRPQDADDVTQDALLRLHRSATSLKDEDALEAWMYRIARNTIIDHHRRSALRPDPIDPDDVAALPSTDADSEPDAGAALAACLAPLLARVPDDYRQALELTDLGDLTQDEAAARLGLSTSGMKSRVQRARAQLRDMLVSCCEIELDRRGGITSYRPRHSPCDCRGGDQR